MTSVGLTPAVASAMEAIAKHRQESIEATVNELLRNFASVFYSGRTDGIISAKETFDKTLAEFKL